MNTRTKLKIYIGRITRDKFLTNRGKKGTNKKREKPITKSSVLEWNLGHQYEHMFKQMCNIQILQKHIDVCTCVTV